MYEKNLKLKTGFKPVIKRIFAMMLLLAIIQTASAHLPKVQITEDRPTILNAFKSIEAQTGLRFFFDQSLDVTRRVDFPKTQISFTQAMDIILRGTNRSYSRRDQFISILEPKAAVTAHPKAVAIQESQRLEEIQRPEEIQGVLIPTHIQRIGVKSEPIIVPEPLGNYQSVSNLGKTPFIAIKTNLLYDATATVSLGAEIKLGHKLTLDLPFTHNSWSTSGDRKWENFIAQPGLRWWTCEAFNGHFFGVHAHYAKFNIANLPSPFSQTMRDYRFEGQLYGLGIHYGYQWILGKRWALEAEIGVGWAHLWGDKYQCGDCGKPVGEFKNDYFGPTKAGISLIYIIK